jgi:peptidoglycan-associated lipoprotein
MRIAGKIDLVRLWVILMVCAAPLTAQAAGERQPLELALDYSYVRSNAPPGDCGCFNLNGGSAGVAFPLGARGLALVGDITATGGNAASRHDLTLSAYTAGVRYRLPLSSTFLHPYGQVLIGLAHAGGNLVQGASNSGAAFAANVGGGVDVSVSRRLWVRVFEADYLVTTFDNGVNDHQNNLRVSAGIIVRF